jgi:RNA polymerase sigma factor (sigma-70 family)
MSQRSNQEWIDELCGKEGKTTQLRAHEDLGKYLCVVAFNYLKGRQAQGNPSALTGFAPEELADLANDFGQDTLEMLIRDDHALLNQYRGEGRFTSYMAVIVQRVVAQELRRSYWQRRVPLPHRSEDNDSDWSASFESFLVVDDTNPEKAAMRRQVVEILKHCLEQLPARQRLAFWKCVAEAREAAGVAHILDTTRNAVYLLVSRARKALAGCLRAHGVDQYG